MLNESATTIPIWAGPWPISGTTVGAHQADLPEVG